MLGTAPNLIIYGMDSKNNGKFTVQGRETPVPVGGGGQAGQSRPKSGNCEASLVRDQAEASSNTTGIQGETVNATPERAGVALAEETYDISQIFRRCDRVRRTPPSGAQQAREEVSADVEISQDRLNVQDVEVAREGGSISISDSEDEGRKRKRKKRGTPPKEIVGGEPEEQLNKLTRKLSEEIKDLEKFCNENRNVHKCVKNASQSLRELMKEVTRSIRKIKDDNTAREVGCYKELRNLEQELEITRAERDNLSKKLQVMSATMENVSPSKGSRWIRRSSLSLLEDMKECKDMCTQTDDAEMSKLLLEQKIANIQNEEDLNTLIENDSVLGAFSFEVSSNSVLGIPDGEDIIVIADMVMNREHRLITRLTETSQKTRRLIREGKMISGKTIRMKLGENVQTDDEEYSQEKYVTFAGMNLEAEDGLRLLKLGQRLRKECEERQRKKIHIAYLDKKKEQKARNILECAFWGFCGNVVWHNPWKKGIAAPEKTNRGDAVLVDLGNHTFAEILGKVRQSLKGSSEADMVRSATKTRSGHLKLEIDKKGGKAADVAALLKNKVEGTKIRAVGAGSPRRAVHLSGLDGLTTIEEVKEALKEYLGEKEEELMVRDLRPQKYGEMQSTTIIVGEKAAIKIVEKGEIRIGLSWCRARLRVDVPVCFRCWEGGHMAVQCCGTDRSRLCRNCGREGHTANGCESPPSCPLCGGADHRAITLGCPKYREEISKRERENVLKGPPVRSSSPNK